MTSTPSDEPPPSYAEATGANGSDQVDPRRHSTSSAPFRPVQYSHGGITVRRIFPPSFSVYAESPCTYMLGETYTKPLYAISTYSSLAMKPDLLLHSGISIDKPVIAAVDHETFGRSATVTLPPRSHTRPVAVKERLDSVGPLTRVMSFSIETTISGGAREHFEWRHSSGMEVEALGGRHSGWKLVRVSAAPIFVSKRHGNTLGHSSDGREVVAVFSGPILFMNKVLRFRFLGAGADGSLGERWAIMAVASALAIWNRERRPRNRSFAVASAGF